ncbi:tRNA-splicing endonuclease subunit SEN2 [Ostrinia furnacalis]|uniref:tRNA-splicing endonuclease subunit SEN2 n=1 Tax=Ostrinia furnacalis TaxID=93504 RepID=UPI00103B05B3|nr:tRNA-splicing endonuclease subunit SEN2 [Ostrinia furnacalis]
MTSSQSDDCQSNDPNNLFPKAIESLRFPLDSTMRIIFTGYFNGFNVEVRSSEEMAMLHHMGCFGKGSLSRSKPKVIQNDDSPSMMRKRQFLKRTDWQKKFSKSKDTQESDTFFRDIDELTAKIIKDGEKSKKKDVIDLVSSDDEGEACESGEEIPVPINMDAFSTCDKQDLVVIAPDSDSEGDNYFANFKPKCCLNKVKVPEKLMLTPCEAFFLSYGLGCLQILNSDGKVLSTDQCWQLFLNIDFMFIPKYVVYHYFRSKGYIVKPGIKFGGDYLLYKEAPGIMHADYIVVIKCEEEQTDWVSLLGHLRMATTTVKEIMLAEVKKTDMDVIDIPDNLNVYSVREIVLSRKMPIAINEDDD